MFLTCPILVTVKRRHTYPFVSFFRLSQAHKRFYFFDGNFFYKLRPRNRGWGSKFKTDKKLKATTQNHTPRYVRGDYPLRERSVLPTG